MLYSRRYFRDLGLVPLLSLRTLKSFESGHQRGQSVEENQIAGLHGTCLVLGLSVTSIPISWARMHALGPSCEGWNVSGWRDGKMSFLVTATSWRQCDIMGEGNHSSLVTGCFCLRPREKPHFRLTVSMAD